MRALLLAATLAASTALAQAPSPAPENKDATRKEQQWAANPVGSDGLFYFIVNQKDPANGVLADKTGHVSLRVGSATLGQDKNWMFYR